MNSDSNEKNILKKRKSKKDTAQKMMRIYCRKKHRMPKKQLCPDCLNLIEYSNIRTDNCPYIEITIFCSGCKTPCYRPDMREKMREVMRFSGPRMLLYHPAKAISHVLGIKSANRHNKN